MIHQLKYRLFGVGIWIGLIVVLIALLLVLVLLTGAEAVIDAAQRLLSVRTLNRMNQLLRLRQRVRDARERTEAGIRICAEVWL